jgi:type IX secretion system PorP/SprF family membrane protein
VQQLGIMFKIGIRQITILLLLVVGLASSASAQDPQFSQFYANPLYTNPAFAGSEICPRVVLNYRNQWPKLPGGFTTYSVSADQHVNFLKGGLGLQVYQDNAGNNTIKTFNVSLSYAYTIEINRDVSLKFGGQGAYWQKSLQWDQLTFGDMIDPRYGFIYSTNEPFGDESVNAPDFSAGMLLYSADWYIGGAVHHLTQPSESFFGLDDAVLYRKYTFQAGATFAIDKKHPDEGSISPNIIYMQQGESTQFNLGMYGRMSVFTVGLWYRFNTKNSDAMILLFGLQNDKFKFGYSYDITVSKLGNATGGAHELSLGFKLKCHTKKAKIRGLVCPSW